MNRFLMLVGVAVVAAAMYVAASPASQQSRGPTARQFRALKKQVTTLSKTLKTVKAEADTAIGIIGDCYLTVSGSSFTWNAMPVSQFGTNTTGPGFLYGTSTVNSPRTALDIAASSPQAYLQEVNPTCATLTGLRHGSARSDNSFLERWAQRTR